MRKAIAAILSLMLFFFNVVTAQQKDPLLADAALLIRSQSILTKIITHDIFSPPVASRIYLYANIAAYETAVLMQDNYKSLHISVPTFPLIKIGEKSDVDITIAVTHAFFRAAKQFVFSENILMDSLDVLMLPYKKMKQAAYERSVTLGNRVADSVIKWAEHDHYKDTRKLRRYSILKDSGKWIPTPPGYISAIEPHWKSMRTIAMDSASQFRPPPAIPFSTEKESVFYKEAMVVYQVLDSLNTEKKQIANFWDCNPFFINTNGHINYAIKKMSPGGHWMMITGIAAGKSGIGLMPAAAAYVLSAIAIYDAFISCWDEKYRSNVIRPETYINSYIDEKWRPFLQTPPFPEYSSGHSVISNAAATVLAAVFGDHFAFDDTSEIEYGAGMRHFSSFSQAADEASLSRLYGGIHYRAAIESGQVQGKNIGKKVLDVIRLN